MTRRLSTMLLIIGAVLALPGLATVAAEGKTVIRLATLAPVGSTWDRVFKAWNKSLGDQTKGAVSIQFFNGGVAGDEKDVIRKMKLNQMDAGAFTTVGLAQIARPLSLLTTPGVIDGYEHLNKVRQTLAPELEAIFDKEGYKLLGWGDAGFGRVMSNRPILMPSDYKAVRPWVPRDEAAFPEFMKIVGANGVPAGIPEVFPALQTGMIDTVMVSAIAAVALQWFRNVKFVAKEAQIPIVGATLIRKDFLATLPPDQLQHLTETGKKAHEVLLKQIAKEDETAYKALTTKLGLKEFSMGATPEQVKAWADVGKELRKRLTGKLWTEEFYKKTMDAAKKKD
ncbi:MAG: TRAP transporter substrate-binding protein DctP [Myxococcales bacterium]